LKGRPSVRPKEGGVLLLGFVAGVVIGLAAGAGFPLAIAAGVVGAVVAFLIPIPFGLLSQRSARLAVPVDLAAVLPDPLSREAYAQLPLAARNAAIARALAEASGREPEIVASALPQMLGRQRISSEASQRRAAGIAATATENGRIDRRRYEAIIYGELDLAVRGCAPRDDRNRARIEQNLAKFGMRLDDQTLLRAILETRLPRIGATVADLIHGAFGGDVDLAFVVGTIRKVGERHAAEIAKVR
jgi:hypothetical protein